MTTKAADFLALHPIDREERERRARILACATPKGRDRIRAEVGLLQCEIDPTFHPIRSRSRIESDLELWCRGHYGRDGVSDAVDICFIAMREAARTNSRGMDLCAPEAIDLWLGRAHGPAPDPPDAAEISLSNLYAALMLLATGGPVTIAPGPHRNNRILTVPAGYADRHLRCCDVRERPHPHWDGRVMAMALALSFAAARRLAGADPGLMGPLRAFMLSIAGSVRADALEDGRLALLADFTPLRIARDWIEEEVSAGIAHNLGQIVDWMEGMQGAWQIHIRRRRGSDPE